MFGCVMQDELSVADTDEGSSISLAVPRPSVCDGKLSASSGSVSSLSDAYEDFLNQMIQAAMPQAEKKSSSKSSGHVSERRAAPIPKEQVSQPKGQQLMAGTQQQLQFTAETRRQQHVQHHQLVPGKHQNFYCQDSLQRSK